MGAAFNTITDGNPFPLINGRRGLTSGRLFDPKYRAFVGGLASIEEDQVVVPSKG
jgi:hypothetical protein